MPYYSHEAPWRYLRQSNDEFRNDLHEIREIREQQREYPNSGARSYHESLRTHSSKAKVI